MGIHLLKWLLGIIIITWVFAIGMKFGEFEAYFEMQAPYGGHNMMFYRTSAAPMTISAQAMPAAAIMGSTGTAGNVTFTTSSVPSGSMKAIEVKN
jgi:hypothetical protein